MTSYRIVIRRTTTEDLEFRVEANTNQEARGRALALLHQGNGSATRHNVEERFVSTKAVGAPSFGPIVDGMSILSAKDKG